MSLTKQQKLGFCAGCSDDFYNGKNSLGVSECWALESAKVCTRYRLGWWIEPTVPGAFQKVRTLECHHAPGHYAHYERLPSFAKAKGEAA